MTEAFTSFDELSARHAGMLPGPAATGATLAGVHTDAIKSFLAKAAATGVHLVSPEQRREVQSIIRFWTAELITRGEIDWDPPPLADARIASDLLDERGRERADRTLARSREAVRIAASARQWKESGQSGWLLKGAALREAQAFAHEDRAIQDLVDASQLAERRASQVRNLVLCSAIVVLAGLCVWLFLALRQSEQSRLRAEGQAEAANSEAIAKGDLAEQLLTAKEELSQRGLEQQKQLNEEQRKLREVAKVMRQLRGERKITPAQIPNSLQPYVAELDREAAPQLSPPDAKSAVLPLPALLSGYDPNFLRSSATDSLTIPLPKPAARVLADTHDGGRPLNYVNFSLVFNVKRRMPLFTAANLMRSGVVAVARSPDLFRYDPRISHEVQMPQKNFAANDLDRGTLVNAREIAWGPAFDFKGDAEAAGERAYGLVTLMTNVVPQFDIFNQGLWMSLERYSQQAFGAKSDRIVIFSGPVLGQDDPLLRDMAVPRSFWKVLITTRPDNPASLLVEAYLASQFKADGQTKIERSARFDQKTHRVRVADLERLTDLDFGELVRAADTISAPVTIPVAQASSSSRMPALLRQSVGPDQEQRRAAVVELLNMMKDAKRVTESDLRVMVEGLVAYASAKSFVSLSWEARVNVLILLRAVQKAKWDLDTWIDLKAVARRAVADASTSLPCDREKQACALLAQLKPNLDWRLANGRTVYVQFAGMVRADVVALNNGLKMLDWRVPDDGGERTAAAAGKNEVRYAGSDEDRRAAELLAADLRVLGRSAVKAVRANVNPKAPEVWISI